MNVLQWIVWTGLAISTLTSFITWIYKKRSYQDGCFYDTREVVALLTIPRVVIAGTILLLVFLFVGVNKLHLLWLFPATYFFINVMMARKVVKADKERMNRASRSNKGEASGYF